MLVAGPFVAELLGVSSPKDPQVGYYSSWIQTAFLIGWALGGGFFGLIADRLGRSRALILTILLFWCLQQLRNLPELASWTDVEVGQLVSKMV